MYTISDEKLAAVTEIFNNETDPSATQDLVQTEICAEWNCDDHQAWIDKADAQEIADWLASFYN